MCLLEGCLAVVFQTAVDWESRSGEEVGFVKDSMAIEKKRRN
jgi:hypothetical protein